MLVPQNYSNRPSKKRKINPSWKNNKINNISNNNQLQQTQQQQHRQLHNSSLNVQKRQQQPKTDDVLINLRVDLLQLYSSTELQTLSVVRNRLCNKCSGSKTDNGCNICFGRGVFPNEKQFQFSICGRSHNDHIIFSGEADQKVGYTSGNIIVILQQIPHQVYERDGVHLYIKKEIVLVEALCGGTFLIKHLDGRIIKFNTLPGEVLSPYQIKCIPNQGMPYINNNKRKGHLFIQFEVKFPPKYSNPHLINVLQKLLPAPPKDPLQDICIQSPEKLFNAELVDLYCPHSDNNNNNNNNNDVNMMT